MQLKLYKRSTFLLSLIVLIEVGSIVYMLTHPEIFKGRALAIIFGFVALMFVLTAVYTAIDLNMDKNLIRKRVSNGDVALAKIKDGTFVRFARDARFKNHVFWKLNVDVYDNDMNKHETTIIEKFSPHQTSIPKGYVYVTYVEGQEEDCLIIPNVIISSIPEYKPLVDDYEKALKPKYLNAYINDGLILESYSDSLAKK
ncbi:MAG: hypothetical protein II174_05565 [Erysipelotrichaceae bacterium]|jgi:hypothetical protein|nr:hypothetical protein [Erysipelotrichaceae bacterium]MBR4610363.1 hypothetical protein [Erysipelotrichaceae bacterium]